ncbi:MAG TPA: ABC transporter permease [Gammaproteobacteria bacterium]
MRQGAGNWMERSLSDLRYAARTLCRSPGTTIIVVLTLAVAIGANSAVFSMVDRVLLRPLPFPAADRLVRITETERDVQDRGIAPLRLEDWNAMSSTFEAITGYRVEDVSDTTGEIAERVRRATVMPRFLEVWGVAPALGRGFSAEEHRWGGPRAALISSRYWQRRFNRDPNVLGRTVRIGADSYPIVGVMPEGFRFPDRDVDLWAAHPLDAPFAQSRQLPWNTGIGRLKPGVTLEQARADLALVQARLGEQYPDTDAAIVPRMVPLIDSIVGGIRGSLWLLFGAVCVLLLTACTNVTALLLTRAVRREQDIAIRFSLGASRAAVFRQIVAESIVLSLAGALVSLLVVAGVFMAVRTLAPDLPRQDELGGDMRTFLYALAVALLVAIVSGSFPALRAIHRPQSLSQWGRGQVSSRHSLQWSLVSIQVALSVMLLVGAGLLLRSFDALSRVDEGFDPSDVLTFRVSASYGEPGGYDGIVQRINNTLDELAALPGVEATATSLMLPGIAARNETEFQIVDGPADPERPVTAELRIVSPDYSRP